jgi:hypothetical protein
VAEELERAVDRFYDQLGREGYRANRVLVGDVYLIEAIERDGEPVLRYIAQKKGDGVHIEDAGGPGT